MVKVMVTKKKSSFFFLSKVNLYQLGLLNIRYMKIGSLQIHIMTCFFMTVIYDFWVQFGLMRVRLFYFTLQVFVLSKINMCGVGYILIGCLLNSLLD